MKAVSAKMKQLRCEASVLHSGKRVASAECKLFDAEGELNRYVNVYLNDEDVRVLDGLGTSVSDGDTVVILPAMAGGSAL